MKNEIPLVSHGAKQSALDAIKDIEPDPHRPMEVIIRKRKLTRSGKMNRCLHLYCTMLAEALNDAGFDFKRFLEISQYKIDVPWTPELVKEQLWRPVQIARTGYESTTEATNFQYQDVYQIIDARVAELTGVSVPWPHQEDEGLE